MTSIVGTVLLAKEEDDNMVSAWVDYLYAHRLADGTYSVTAEKLMLDQEEESEDEELITIDSIQGIATPRQFVDAVNRCSMTIEVEVYWSDALKALSELDKDFSAQVQSLVE
jgi:hypothetical protein